MKKINNISIGGIQQKIFNLVLIMILLVLLVGTLPAILARIREQLSGTGRVLAESESTT